MNNTTDFRYMWTLSAGEAEPPRSLRSCGSRLSRISLQSIKWVVLH